MDREGIINNFTPNEINDYIQTNHNIKDYMIIDLRSPANCRKNRLSNALNINYNDENFEIELEKLDRNRVYLIYCSWDAKSNIASEMMADLGFAKIIRMIGGISAWHKDDFLLEHDE